MLQQKFNRAFTTLSIADKSAEFGLSLHVFQSMLPKHAVGTLNESTVRYLELAAKKGRASEKRVQGVVGALLCLASFEWITSAVFGSIIDFLQTVTVGLPAEYHFEILDMPSGEIAFKYLVGGPLKGPTPATRFQLMFNSIVDIFGKSQNFIFHFVQSALCIYHSTPLALYLKWRSKNVTEDVTPTYKHFLHDMTHRFIWSDDVQRLHSANDGACDGAQLVFEIVQRAPIVPNFFEEHEQLMDGPPLKKLDVSRSDVKMVQMSASVYSRFGPFMRGKLFSFLNRIGCPPFMHPFMAVANCVKWYVPFLEELDNVVALTQQQTHYVVSTILGRTQMYPSEFLLCAIYAAKMAPEKSDALFVHFVDILGKSAVSKEVKTTLVEVMLYLWTHDNVKSVLLDKQKKLLNDDTLNTPMRYMSLIDFYRACIKI
jgi:hypothetical protein